MAQNRHAPSTCRAVVAGHEKAACGRRHAKNVEEVLGDRLAEHPLL
jgi:hypothetical protein